MNKPKFEERKEANLAYIEHRGSYDKVPWDEYMAKLYGWAKEQRVMPGFHPMGIYYDDPLQVIKEQCRSDIGITFKGNAQERGEIKIRSMPTMKVATVSLKGPGTEFQKAYQDLARWIEAKGHRISGPSMEIYSKKPDVIDGITTLYCKIAMPVEPK